MDIDAKTAAALGWPKLKYAAIERERRWLCAKVPDEQVLRAEAITDLYIARTHLRLREAIPLSGGETMRRLGRKADVTPTTRILTSIYLSPTEYALLSALPGLQITKVRHHLVPVHGISVCIDQFTGHLDGLVLAEAEFADDQTMAAYPMPAFADHEVTDDARYTGGMLARGPIPA